MGGEAATGGGGDDGDGEGSGAPAGRMRTSAQFQNRTEEKRREEKGHG